MTTKCNFEGQLRRWKSTEREDTTSVKNLVHYREVLYMQLRISQNQQMIPMCLPNY